MSVSIHCLTGELTVSCGATLLPIQSFPLVATERSLFTGSRPACFGSKPGSTIRRVSQGNEPVRGSEISIVCIVHFWSYADIRLS